MYKNRTLITISSLDLNLQNEFTKSDEPALNYFFNLFLINLFEIKMISLIFFTLILVLRILIILIEYMSIVCYIINKN